MAENNVHSRLNQLMAKTLSDEILKAQLIENPRATLNAEGIKVPANMGIQVLENTDKVFHLVLPQTTSELSDEDLDHVVGGTEWSNSWLVFGGSEPLMKPK